jgi:non-ribosomal peptide synthetase component E (peptide arylation enzyme)
MLDGCVPWPPEFAARYRADGCWRDNTLWRMIERAIERAPDKIAIVHPDGRVSFVISGTTSGGRTREPSEMLLQSLR